jgi:lipoprotein-anchoring transpeptidase ErfK/SrfK
MRKMALAILGGFILLGTAGMAASGARAETQFNFGAEQWKLDSRFLRTTISYDTTEAPGTIVINTRRKFLYYVLGNRQAIRYGIGVGRDGFKWYGTEKISRKEEWPDWHPPAEMRQRDPSAPEFMKGGADNPLGARALYLGNSLYRIHGTREPWSIGLAVSSGCFRLLNEDVIDLYGRAKVGTKVIIE